MLRKLGGVRVGFEAIVLSIVSLGMIDAIAMLPLSISATATSGSVLRGPLLIVVVFGIGCCTLLVVGGRLIRLPLLRRSRRLRTISEHVARHTTTRGRRDAIVAWFYLFACWSTRAFGSAALLTALGFSFSPTTALSVICLSAAAGVIPITSGGAVVGAGATAGHSARARRRQGHRDQLLPRLGPPARRQCDGRRPLGRLRFACPPGRGPAQARARRSRARLDHHRGGAPMIPLLGLAGVRFPLLPRECASRLSGAEGVRRVQKESRCGTVRRTGRRRGAPGLGRGGRRLSRDGSIPEARGTALRARSLDVSVARALQSLIVGGPRSQFRLPEWLAWDGCSSSRSGSSCSGSATAHPVGTRSAAGSTSSSSSFFLRSRRTVGGRSRHSSGTRSEHSEGELSPVSSGGLLAAGGRNSGLSTRTAIRWPRRRSPPRRRSCTVVISCERPSRH